MTAFVAPQAPADVEGTSSNSGLDLDRLADLIADRVVARLAAPPADLQFVDAQTLADALGVHRSYVYANAVELGGVKVGAGPKARWRFDLQAAAAMVTCDEGKRSVSATPSSDARSTTPRRRGQRRLPNGLPKPGRILTAIPSEGSTPGAA